MHNLQRSLPWQVGAIWHSVKGVIYCIVDQNSILATDWICNLGTHQFHVFHLLNKSTDFYSVSTPKDQAVFCFLKFFQKITLFLLLK